MRSGIVRNVFARVRHKGEIVVGVSANTVVKEWKKPKRFQYGSSTARPSPGKKRQAHAKWHAGDPLPKRSRAARQAQFRRALEKTRRTRAAHA